jgi:superfamily II DNA or RNA helicase
LQEFSRKQLDEGNRLLQEGAVRAILFSEGTYQVEVVPLGQEGFWPFLQLEDSGVFIDAFCSCAETDQNGLCSHLAAAHSKIMVLEEPLHVRFRSSLWNYLGHLAAKRYGFSPDCLKEEREAFVALGEQGEESFRLEPKGKGGKAAAYELLFNRPLETEETSLKFSNLPQEEIALWKEGRPSFELQYELSFWSDLAKWWMILTENGGQYSLEFSPANQLPRLLRATFDPFVFEFALFLADWPAMVPTLTTVESPLSVFDWRTQAIDEIRYDAEGRRLQLHFAQSGAQIPEPPPGVVGEKVGSWEFFPGVGFFPRKIDPAMRAGRVETSRLSSFLDEYSMLIEKHLKGDSLHLSPEPLRYHLEFDSKGNLHIEAYLFHKGDLSEEGAAFFADWVYLKEKGFYPITEQLFDKVKTEVPRQRVGDFISRHRNWLQGIEGFQTHVSGIEAPLGSRFNESGWLELIPRGEFAEEGDSLRDYGEWIYSEGKGFYAKVVARPGSRLRPGMKIAPEEIASFIKGHREELETVGGFFTAQCPLEKAGVNIAFNDEGRIVISPEYFFKKGVEAKQVTFFGDFTYEEGKGFSPIPSDCRLPERYQSQREIDEASQPYFVGYELDLLYPHVLTIDPRLKRPAYLHLHLKRLRLDPKIKVGRWMIELAYVSDVGEVLPHNIWEALVRKEPYIFSDAGLLLLKDLRFEWLKRKNKKKWLQKGATLRFTTLELFQLVALEEIYEPLGESQVEKKSRALWRQFISFQPPTTIDTSGLESQLRPYQKVGVSWLWFLYSYGLSGLLCDEMGLGKTHQAMALMAGIKNIDPQAKFLVVCPTSVIYHWEELIKRFLPGQKSYVFHGLQRNFDAFAEDSHDILLTSYGIARTEKKAISSFTFHLAVFDEIQIAKNHKSQTHLALKSIEASMRLGLTGTPIENRLLELKSLFDVTISGYLPSESIFRELFVNPIEKHKNTGRMELFKRTVKPFLLRRKKAEVLTELPEKIEEVLYCDMFDEQRALYRAIYKEHRDEILKGLEDKSKPLPLAHVFSLLSKLKQVSNHPCLITKEYKNYKQHQSGKWDLFKELLAETRDSDQKLVVFTQYLGMLDIMGAHLKEQGIEFAEIRGSTKKRKEEVQRFQKDPNCVVFLGSLQAAGVGIDLIAASVVIHYDRWWNPAKENQATDRVHRMGQKRGVQVFKLVTKHSVEEEIHRLIERKIQLTNVVGFDVHDRLKGFERDELISLIQHLGQEIGE